MLKFINSLLSFFMLMYCAALAGYLVLRVGAGDAFWWLALLNTFALYLFVPLIGILPLALLLRSRLTGIWAVLLSIIGVVWLLLPALLPNSIPAHETATLKIVAYNLLGVDRPLAADISWLLATDADVIFLEEVVAEGEDPRLRRLKAEYPYEARVDGGQRIFARYPLQSTAIVWIEDPSPGRVALKAVIEFEGRAISLYGVHLSVPRTRQPHFNVNRFPFNRLPVQRFPFSFMLSYDETRRNAQIDRLLAILRADPNPVILAGDFNTSATSVAYGRIASVLKDTHAEVGHGLGHTWAHSPVAGAPAWLPPLLRIDYIWHSAGLVALTHEVAPPLGSDHFPVVAALAWKK
jgi:vancomycin resistance protein VanJ